MLQIHKYTNSNTTSVQVQTEDQYQFCYRAALEYLSSFDHYTDNWQSAGLELGVWANYVILRLFGNCYFYQKIF